MNEKPNGKQSLLVVGNLSDWIASGKDLPRDGDIVFSDFADLSEAFLIKIRPELVLSQLLATGFDAVDLAHRLCDLGYVGRYVALTGPLVHADLIKAEVDRSCPNLEFDIIEIGAASDVRTL